MGRKKSRKGDTTDSEPEDVMVKPPETLSRKELRAQKKNAKSTPGKNELKPESTPPEKPHTGVSPAKCSSSTRKARQDKTREVGDLLQRLRWEFVESGVHPDRFCVLVEDDSGIESEPINDTLAGRASLGDRLCRRFVRNGVCERGDKCHYSHELSITGCTPTARAGSIPQLLRVSLLDALHDLQTALHRVYFVLGDECVVWDREEANSILERRLEAFMSPGSTEAASGESNDLELSATVRSVAQSLLPSMPYELVATDLCPRLQIRHILACNSTSRSMRHLFSNDLVWLELCAHYGLPPPTGINVRKYFISAQTTSQWETQLRAGLGGAMMLEGSAVMQLNPLSARWYALQGHTSRITCMAVDAPCGQVCTADEDGKLTVWDCERGHKLGKSGVKCCVAQLDL